MQRAVLIMVVIVLIVLPNMSTASQRESLLGIQGITVSVMEESEDKIIPNSTLERQIQTDVELRLRLAGIKVIPKKEWKSYQQGELSVCIEGSEINFKSGEPTDYYIYSISVIIYLYVYTYFDTLMKPICVGVWDKASTAMSKRLSSMSAQEKMPKT